MTIQSIATVREIGKSLTKQSNQRTVEPRHQSPVEMQTERTSTEVQDLSVCPQVEQLLLRDGKEIRTETGNYTCSISKVNGETRATIYIEPGVIYKSDLKINVEVGQDVDTAIQKLTRSGRGEKLEINSTKLFFNAENNEIYIVEGGLKGGSKLRDLIMEKVHAAEAYSNRAVGQDIMVVLGTTGAGKSVFTNYMHGCDMSSVRIKGVAGRVIECSNPVTPIGHDKHSKTTFPILCEGSALTGGLGFGDFPGFFDNRGADFDISNAYATQAVMSKAKSIRGIVLLVNYPGILTKRGEAIREAADTLKQIFGPDVMKYTGSIRLGITRPDREESLQDLKHIMAADDVDPVIRALVPTMFVSDPLDRPMEGALNRAQLVRHLQGCKPIRNAADALRFNMSLESKLALESVVDEISAELLQDLKAGKNKDAASKLADINGLSIIPHPKVVTLFNETKRKVARFFAEQAKAVHKAYHSENPGVAEGIINQLKAADKVFRSAKVGIQQALKQADAYAKAYKKKKADELEAKIQGYELKISEYCALFDFTKARSVLVEIGKLVKKTSKRYKDQDRKIARREVIKQEADLNAKVRELIGTIRTQCLGHNYSEARSTLAKIDRLIGNSHADYKAIKEETDASERKHKADVEEKARIDRELAAEKRRRELFERRTHQNRLAISTMERADDSVNHTFQRDITNAIRHALQRLKSDIRYTSASYKWPAASWGKSFRHNGVLYIEIYDDIEKEWLGFDQNGVKYRV